MLSNTQDRVTDLDRAILRPAFLRGWRSIRRGTPFDYADGSMLYERGRQIAIVTRQILGHIPPLPQGLELVRPIYLDARLRQWSPGHTQGFERLRDPETGGLSTSLYAAQYIKPDLHSGKSLDNLLGL